MIPKQKKKYQRPLIKVVKIRNMADLLLVDSEDPPPDVIPVI